MSRSLVLRAFPQPHQLPQTPQAVDRNVLIYAKATRIYWKPDVAPFSVMTNFTGYSTHDLDKRRLVLSPQTLFIQNRGQSYTNQIRSDSEVEAMRLIFTPHFTERVYTSLTTASETLLDRPADLRVSAMTFYDKLYRDDRVVMPLLGTLRDALQQGEAPPMWIDEKMVELAERLSALYADTMREIARLPAVKAATREELYKRLHCAKEFMDAQLSEAVTLEETAAAACLSTHHFLRLFKAAFHQTPHGYLTARRIERAKHLLRQRRKPVMEICVEVGFESLGSFSSLFRKQTGVSPTAFRAAL